MKTVKIALNKTIIAVVALTALFLVSCRGVPVDYFEYCRSPFCAKVSGMVDGVDVEAVVRYSPTDSAEQKTSPIMTVTFSSPEGLDGLVVSLRSDGTTAIRLGGVVEDSSLFDGMLLPFFALCPSEKYSSINIDDEGKAEAVFSDDGKEITYSFDPEGKLCRVTGRVEERSFELNVRFEE